MDIQEIIDRNYAATSRRGLITPDTTKKQFMNKIHEEAAELQYELGYELWATGHGVTELADVILVCLAMAKHFNIDILQVLEEKTLYNETR